MTTKDLTEKKQTVAEKLWEEIKNVKVNMFALPSKTVQDHCNMVPIEPTKLYLSYKASAVIPAIEEALGPSFKVEAVDKYIVVSKANGN